MHPHNREMSIALYIIGIYGERFIRKIKFPAEIAWRWSMSRKISESAKHQPFTDFGNEYWIGGGMGYFFFS